AAWPLATLTEHTLAAWQQALPASIAPATRKRISTDFKAALNASGRMHRKDLPADFATIIKHGLSIKEPPGANGRENQILTDADIGGGLEAGRQVDERGEWNGSLYRLLIVLAATGARFSQVTRMTVADVQPSRFMVPASGKGRGSKSGNKIAVPVGP